MTAAGEEALPVDTSSCVGFDLATVPGLLSGKGALDPARFLPAADAPSVRYDARLVRRRLGVVGLGAAPVLDVERFIREWDVPYVSRSSWSARLTAREEADVNLDPIAQTWGTVGELSTLVHSRRATLTLTDRVVLSRIQAVRAYHAHARSLAAAHLATGGFPRLPGHLAPDERIDCVIERAYSCAATAIAHSPHLDPLLAMSWASAIVVAHGCERPTHALGQALPSLDSNPGLRPRRTHLSDYFGQAIVDLRLHHDATRFMTVTARMYSYSIGERIPGIG